MRALLRVVGWLFVLVLLVVGGFRVAAAFRERETHRPSALRLVPTTLGAVAADIQGPANGPSILLIHGTAGWSGFWRDVTAHLAERGWRVIAVDLPPFGYSDHDPKARYDRASQAQRLSAVLSATAGRPTVVVGHSFGAGAATELALRHPGQVKRLVLVDAALGELDPVDKGPTMTNFLLGQSMVAQPLVSMTVTNPMALPPLVRSMVYQQQSVDRWLPTLERPMRRKGTTSAYAAWLPALFALDDGGQSRHRKQLAAIKPPVGLIWGEEDTVTPIAQGEALAKLTHAHPFIRLPGVGHIPHIEDPSGFIDALDKAIAPRRKAR